MSGSPLLGDGRRLGLGGGQAAPDRASQRPVAWLASTLCQSHLTARLFCISHIERVPCHCVTFSLFSLLFLCHQTIGPCVIY